MVEKMLTRDEFNALGRNTIILVDCHKRYVREIGEWVLLEYEGDTMPHHGAVSDVVAYDVFENFQVLSMPIGETLVGPRRCARVGCKHRILLFDGEWVHIDTLGYKIDHVARPPKHFTVVDGVTTEVKIHD